MDEKKAARQAIDLPNKLPVLVLQDALLFPGALMALQIDDDDAARAKERIRAGGGMVAVVAARRNDESAEESEGEGSEPDEILVELHDVGVAARIQQLAEVDGQHTMELHGVARIRLGEILERSPQLVAAIEPIPEQGNVSSPQVQALVLQAKKLAREILALLPGIPPEVARAVQEIDDPSALADTLAHRVPGSIAEKQRALEELDVEKRLNMVVAMLTRRREVLQVSSKIDASVRESVGKAEREHILRRKLQAIQKELGEDEESGKNVLEEKLKDKVLPDEVRKMVDRELSRLGRIPAQSPEHNVSRTWLQWVADLPWGERSEDHLDLESAQAILDGDHHGLAKVKKRIISYLAVRRLKNDLKGPILCLSGPPGVGKTSLGQSIAKAMGRKLVRVSLGGVRDEAEIRGHRRTYVGAMPGRIIQALKRAGTRNPVMLLDEVDKLGRDGAHGDPAAALLEVLDPEQNNTFADHYLEVPYDLSQVLFLATANTLETIPGPLRDRMEIIELPGYTLDEKVAIAKKHLVNKQLEAHGIGKLHVEIEDAALERIAQGHTREAGVRTLEKRIADVCRALAVESVSGSLPEGAGRVVSADEIETLLGPDKFEEERAARTSEPGVAAGLAWTPAGGDALFVEAAQMAGKGVVILSGQLGSVMKESAQAALSWVKANADRLGLKPGAIDKQDLHIHVPAGATPKDGPSAGVTLASALVSLLTGIRVRSDTAMTGEITLRGRVLPVGGIKEKILAAHRLGYKRVCIPRRNDRDLADVPETARRELEIILADQVEDVLAAVLETNPIKVSSGVLDAASSGTADHAMAAKGK